MPCQLCHALVQAEASQTRISPARRLAGTAGASRRTADEKREEGDNESLACDICVCGGVAARITRGACFDAVEHIGQTYFVWSSDLRHLRDVCEIATALLRVRVDAGIVLLGTHRHMYGESSNSTWLIAYGHA